jgi:hypothetical protein
VVSPVGSQPAPATKRCSRAATWTRLTTLRRRRHTRKYSDVVGLVQLTRAPDRTDQRQKVGQLGGLTRPPRGREPGNRASKATSRAPDHRLEQLRSAAIAMLPP